MYARDCQVQHNQNLEINRENFCTGCSYGGFNVKPVQDKQIRDNQIVRIALIEFMILQPTTRFHYYYLKAVTNGTWILAAQGRPLQRKESTKEVDQLLV